MTSSGRSGTGRCCNWPPNSTSIQRRVGQRRAIRRFTLHTAPRPVSPYMNHTRLVCTGQAKVSARVGSALGITSILGVRARRCVRPHLLIRIGQNLYATWEALADVEALGALAIVPVEAVPIRAVARPVGWAATAARFAAAHVLLAVNDAIGATGTPTQVGATSL